MKVVLILLLLVGCATKDIPITAALEDKVININKELLVPCASLFKLPDNPSFENVLTVTVKNMEHYRDCSLKQDASIQMIKKLSNYKEPIK